LLAFPPEEKLSEVVRNWKGYTARKQGIVWERNFFEHRLRDDEQWELKADYIRQNPVRKGLIGDASKWPYILAP
jgi:putative transposase